jgi:hypothetical protein
MTDAYGRILGFLDRALWTLEGIKAEWRQKLKILIPHFVKIRFSDENLYFRSTEEKSQ